MAWSYSSLKKFILCPKQYYHLKVVKDIKEDYDQIRVYGEDIHEILEKAILDNTPVPEKHKQYTDFVERLKSFKGAKFPEYKLGLLRNGNSVTECDFWDKNVWWRGKADLIILRKDKAEAKLFDYKTGNPKYADPSQLNQLAVGVFHHFPEVNRIRAGLLFILKNEVVKRDYERSEVEAMQKKMFKEVQLLEEAHEKQVFPPKVSWACKRCPVTKCSFNEREVK